MTRSARRPRPGPSEYPRLRPRRRCDPSTSRGAHRRSTAEGLGEAKSGLSSRRELRRREVFVSNAVGARCLAASARRRRYARSAALLDEMAAVAPPDVVSYTTAIRACSRRAGTKRRDAFKRSRATPRRISFSAERARVPEHPVGRFGDVLPPAAGAAVRSRAAAAGPDAAKRTTPSAARRSRSSFWTGAYGTRSRSRTRSRPAAERCLPSLFKRTAPAVRRCNNDQKWASS